MSIEEHARKVQGYGWRPDTPDARDHLFAARPETVGSLPGVVSLRDKMPPVYDQGQLGSCTANAIGAALEFSEMQEGDPPSVPSRLFIYYNERVIEGTVNSDSGAEIRDGIKSVATVGAAPETDWPYEIAKFAEKPPQKAYDDAPMDRAVNYQRVLRDRLQLRACLASGYPFVFGFTVYESFESQEVADTGVVPMPEPGERAIGGHAVLAIGYDLGKKLPGSLMMEVRNSWGPDWGDQGHFWMHMIYLTDPNLASDFWTIRLTT